MSASPRVAMTMTVRPRSHAFKRYAALTALIALLAFNFAVTPHFASWQTLNVNLTQVATIVIVSVGMTLVIATGGIDLSVGSLMAISGALAPLIFLSSFGRSYPALGDALAFIVPIGVAGLFGLFNGWFITRFQVQPIVGTLVMFIAGRGIGQVVTNGNLQPFHNPTFQFIGLGRIHRCAVPGHRHAGADQPDGSLDAARHIVRPSDPSRSEATRRAAPFSAGSSRSLRSSDGSMRSAAFAPGIAGLVVISMNSSSDANLVALGMELDAIAAVAVGGTPFTGGQATVVGSLYRRALNPARALQPVRQRRPRRRGAGREGRDHRRRGVVAAAGPGRP